MRDTLDCRRGNPNILLAFDFGLARIGIATANLHTRTASPLITLANGRKLPWTDLDQLIDQWSPDQLVVGLPDPHRSAVLASSVREFVEAIEERYQLPVATIDESLTSQAASSELREARRSGFLRRRVKKAQIDSHAACLIAQQWMASQPNKRPGAVP